MVAGALAHARWRRVPNIPEFAMIRPGCWSVPSLERDNLVLTADSRCGGWWIRMVLDDPEVSLSWILYYDQLPPTEWRELAYEARKAVCGTTGEPGRDSEVANGE